MAATDIAVTGSSLTGDAPAVAAGVAVCITCVLDMAATLALASALALVAIAVVVTAAGRCCRKVLRLVCPALTPLAPGLLLLPFLETPTPALGIPLGALWAMTCAVGAVNCSAVEGGFVLLLLLLSLVMQL